MLGELWEVSPVCIEIRKIGGWYVVWLVYARV